MTLKVILMLKAEESILKNSPSQPSPSRGRSKCAALSLAALKERSKRNVRPFNQSAAVGSAESFYRLLAPCCAICHAQKKEPETGSLELRIAGSMKKINYIKHIKCKNYNYPSGYFLFFF